MPGYSRYRRYYRSRRGRGGRPDTGYKNVRMARRREIPSYTPGRAYCRKLVHMVPLSSAVDNVLQAAGTGTAFSRHHLNVIPQGDGLDMRHANKTMCRMLYINGVVSSTQYPLAANFFYEGKLAVVWDRESRGLPPSFLDIYDNPQITSFPRLDYRERFQILYEKTYSPEPSVAWYNTNTQAANLYWSQVVKLRIPINRMTIWQTGVTGGTIAEIEKGGLFLIFMSPATVGNPSLSLEYQYKLTFEDLE